MKRIAVIEDNPDNRLLLQALLEEHYQVHEFETGLEALEALPTLKPHLVLMDISLPGMDGLEVLERMKSVADLAQLPVIALTAHAMAGDRERFLAHGFDDYISKPILDEDALIGTIQALLEQIQTDLQSV